MACDLKERVGPRQLRLALLSCALRDLEFACDCARLLRGMRGSIDATG